MRKLIYFLFAFSFLIFTSCGGDASNETSMETSVDSSSSTYACPHCAGLGRRTNNVTGMFGDCSSCGGDGQVTQSEYDRLSK